MEKPGYRITVKLPDDLARRVKIAAVERRTTLQKLATQALEAEIKRGGSK